MVETDPRLLEHRKQWQRKPVLRAVYKDFHRRIAEACVPGRTLDVGAGSGHMDEDRADVTSLDILPAPWLDVVGDAQLLPFSDASFNNLVMLDVFHHLEDPVRGLEEIQRVLRPGGRLVMIEPGISPVSWVFYKLFHAEPVDMKVDPLSVAGPSTQRRDSFDSNQAMPTLLFARRVNRERLHATVPQLRLIEVAWLGLFAYPLSGGFRPWSLVPPRFVPVILRVEERIRKNVGRLLAFRLMVVMERRRY